MKTSCFGGSYRRGRLNCAEMTCSDPETRIDREQVVHAAQHQPGAGDEHQGQRHFGKQQARRVPPLDSAAPVTRALRSSVSERPVAA